jgi:hypothetical protein
MPQASGPEQEQVRVQESKPERAEQEQEESMP